MREEKKVQSLRLCKIDEEIRCGKYPNASTLAKKFEVSTRTIARDLDFLRDRYYAPLEYDSAHNGYYYTEESFYLKTVSLTESELFSIAVFDPLLEQYRNTPLEQKLKKIFTKIAQSLPDTVSVNSDFIESSITMIPDHLAQIDTDTFEKIFNALKSTTTVSFEYRPLQKTTYMERLFNPYHVVCQHGNWYVIGYCHDKGDVRIFSFSRIKNIKEYSADGKKQHFTVPKDFDANNYIDSNTGVWVSSRQPVTIKLRFAKEIGTFAEEHFWHENQKVVQNNDGSVDISFRTNQMPEVKRWVLGQGATVQILEPQELIDDVKAEAKKLLEMYMV